MRTVPTKTTYLQMLRRPSSRLPQPPEKLHIQCASQPSVEEYRRIYQAVGEAFCWVDRLLLAPEELRAIIQNDQIQIYWLKTALETAGFCELDLRRPGEVEVAYFGLLPQFCSRGWGKYFLQWTIHQAWSLAPQRVWLHTCDLDHPAALPNYLKAGFQVYDEKIIEQRVLDC